MSHYFLDSSALVKRYVPEVGTIWVRSIVAPTSGNSILVASVTSVEVVSAVMRRSREGAITASIAKAVRLLLNRHANREYLIVGMTTSIVKRAEDLLEVHPLRAYDSLQLASALETNDRFVVAGLTPVVFVSADMRLLTVAVAEGLTTDNPNSHP